MKKVKSTMIVLLSVLLVGCANSNSTEEPIGADTQIEQNINQTDKEEENTIETEGSALNGVTESEFIENDEQYDSQTDLIPNNDLPYGRPVM